MSILEIDENEARNQMVKIGTSLFNRGLTPGTSGNMSLRLDDGWLMTPTSSCIGELVGDEISKLDKNWQHISGKKPTKEVFLHRAFYESRPHAGAVVHLHSPYAVAVSCLTDLNINNVLPAMTPYAVMTYGLLALAPYFCPGDDTQSQTISNIAQQHAAILLANHGPIVSAVNLKAAANASEELEQAAMLQLTLHGRSVQYLTDPQIADLQKKYPLK